MKKLLLTLIVSVSANIGFADDMPPEVERLKSLRDRKIAKANEEIDAVYYRQLDKLKKKYAAQGNYIAAAYIEKMQIADIDAKAKGTPDGDRPSAVLVQENFDDPDKALWSLSPDIRYDKGEVQALKNGQKLQLKQVIDGDFLVKMKISLEGDHRHSGWDFYIHLIEPNILGTVRFDHKGTDSILICKGKTGTAYPGCERQSRNNRGLEGTLELERRGSKIQLRFINESGGGISDEVTIEDFEKTSIVFGLAGHPTTPRCVEEIVIKRPN